MQNNQLNNIQEATLGAGCFWCVEAIFKQLRGVVEVESGYAGGERQNPTYEQVCSGATGHAEVVRVKYDPNELSFEDLLRVFWNTHDPTTPNKQGADVGTQYRSVVFYENDEQKKTSQKVKEEIEVEGIWDSPIVTTFEPLKNYSPAEDYHQNYFASNPDKPYCSMVIGPKIKKFRNLFEPMLES